MKVLILIQAMQLYQLGVELESERRNLNELINQHGIFSKHSIKQAQTVNRITAQFYELEKLHIAITEQHIYCEESII